MKTIAISGAARLKSAYHHTPGHPHDVLAGLSKRRLCGEWLRRYWQPVGSP